ncbi:hypothetical protein CYY_007343 [Polysphondylium violaceum]|uniref:RecQ-mediated genome instability protein 1 n=1 Tax=Polysphondylium violaceum TaxID=133409 RepID=A0A8J4PR41_9MYCE|nr:hypothetical protein CYY_007343 [Polysphondylium violaceum]
MINLTNNSTSSNNNNSINNNVNINLINDIDKRLEQSFIIVSKEWIKRCLYFLSTNNEYRSKYSFLSNISGGTMRDTDKDTLTNEVYKQFLWSDIKNTIDDNCSNRNNAINEQMANEYNTIDIKDQTLQGPFVLQINSIINISESYETRYQDDNSFNRTLKLTLTNGKYSFNAIEYKHISFFNPNIPPGTKAIIKNVQIKRGLLLLDNTNIRLLGGFVKRLVSIRDNFLKVRNNRIANILKNTNNTNNNNNNNTNNNSSSNNNNSRISNNNVSNHTIANNNNTINISPPISNRVFVPNRLQLTKPTSVAPSTITTTTNTTTATISINATTTNTTPFKRPLSPTSVSTSPISVNSTDVSHITIDDIEDLGNVGHNDSDEFDGFDDLDYDDYDAMNGFKDLDYSGTQNNDDIFFLNQDDDDYGNDDNDNYQDYNQKHQKINNNHISTNNNNNNNNRIQYIKDIIKTDGFEIKIPGLMIIKPRGNGDNTIIQLFDGMDSLDVQMDQKVSNQFENNDSIQGIATIIVKQSNSKTTPTYHLTNIDSEYIALFNNDLK